MRRVSATGHKQIFAIVLGVAVSAACFWYSARNVDWEQFTQGFRTADYRTLPLILLLLLAFYWLKAIRWSQILNPVKPLRASELFPVIMIGFAANNILPAHLGEFVRVFLVRRQFGVPAITGLSTVVLERLFDVLAILAVFSIGLLFSDELPVEYHRGARWLGIVTAATVLGIAIYLLWSSMFLRFAAGAIKRIPFCSSALTDKFLDLLHQGSQSLTALQSGRAVALITCNSLLQWIANALIAYLTLNAFGIPVSVATGFVVTGVTALAVTVPSTPGYFGVIQVAFVASLTAQGFTGIDSQILGASFYYQISMYIPVTAWGLYYLNAMGLKMSTVGRNVGALSDTEPPRTSSAKKPEP